MAPRSGRQAVYLVVPPPDWKPQRPWDFPPTFSEGELVTKNLRLTDAAGYARSYNKAALDGFQQHKQPIDKWAIVSRHLKSRWHDRSQQRRGGAA